MEKIALFRSLVIAGLLCLFIRDLILWFVNPAYRIPAPHKDMLFGCCLLWFASLFLNPNSDDDWAGQF